MKRRKQEYGRMRMDSGHHRRILAVGLVLGVLAFIPVSVRLWYLMVAKYDYYADRALQNQTRVTGITGQRGVIYDRNMNILACSEGVENLYLDPREMKQSHMDLKRISEDLSEILSLPAPWIEEQGKDLTRRYKQIAARLDSETAGKIRMYINENSLTGIHLEPGVRRCYPWGTLASQVIGFTNASGTGCEGIEASYNSFLEGTGGQVITTKGNNEMDMPFSYENYLVSRPGSSLTLTLDTTVQACLEKQMQAACARYGVENGAFGMVMQAKTGEILAMATLGGYNPNRYQELGDPAAAARVEALRQAYLCYPQDSRDYLEGKAAYSRALQEERLKQWRNRCISDGYEPGSTFKVLTMAAALDCGAIDLNTNFFCSGSEQIPGRAQLLHCWRAKGHGAEKTPQALQNSCNIAFAHIALKLGGRRFYEYVQKFGILEKTGIDLAGESKGIFFDEALVTDTEKWGTASLTSGSFGQTFKLTPLQLVRAVAAVVNGGYLMEPYLVSEITDPEGNLILRQEPTVVRQVIQTETSRTMCALLESVVTEGTAKNAAVCGFRIGGKTGTSEKIDVFDEKGQRVLDKIVSFIGVAPMDNPEYIVLVALDTPSRQSGIYISGGVMAAPTVGAVMGDILPYLGVSREFPQEDPRGRREIMPELIGAAVEEARKALTARGLEPRLLGAGDRITGQIPAGGLMVPGDSQVILYTEEVPQRRMVPVPDFMGMTRQQASDAAGQLGLFILPEGNPGVTPEIVVTAQSEQKEIPVPEGTVIRLEFKDPGARD